MLRIKLSRVGKRKQPSYRILVTERQRDPWGKFIENVGTYNPLTNPATIKLNEERIKHWLSVGAQPTDTVHNMLVSAGIVNDKKRNVSALGKEAREAKAKVAEEAKKAKMDAAAAAKAAKEAAAAPAAEAPKA
jgi:small subunit ribosomal protein S16